jgi:tRNA-dihydrouridine synthase B
MYWRMVRATLEPLTIGSLGLSTNLLLAPIAGYCDMAFRLVARSCGGVGMACTDLLSPEGVLRENKHTMSLATTCEADSPRCPVDKITKRDGGSKLLCDPDKTLRMVERIKAVLRHTPLTAKLRLGWDDTCIVAPQLAARLENAGCSLITIHGRTTEMRFTGKARLDGIASVVAAVKHIPVIGNGDIRSPHDALHMIQTTGCAGLMIGRGALSMPWIFRDTWSYLTTGVIPPPLSIQEKCQLLRDHFRHMAGYRGERPAVMEFRKRISWYAKEMNPCRMLRDDMRIIETRADFESAIERFLDWRLNHDEQRQQGREEEAGELVASSSAD